MRSSLWDPLFPFGFLLCKAVRLQRHGLARFYSLPAVLLVDLLAQFSAWAKQEKDLTRIPKTKSKISETNR